MSQAVMTDAQFGNAKILRPAETYKTIPVPQQGCTNFIMIAEEGKIFDESAGLNARTATVNAKRDAEAAVEAVKAKWKPLWDIWHKSSAENDPGSESEIHAHRMNADQKAENRAKKIGKKD